MGIPHHRVTHVVFALVALSLGGTLSGEPEWPGFRGPDSNPVAKGQLAETWSRTENVEWMAEIPGRGWSSPIVNGRKVFLTTVTTDGKSKQPQIGAEYSNEYATQLIKEGRHLRPLGDRHSEPL
jgi:hypothetical protein